ncbi:putative X-ray repair cross-complementing protein 5 [Paratrimastix pyriformis]|uniref:X-ray repair cross-complementing protein 5 n=1 Tax=Paratrimastix pyriformis TaxID=342808 RepID=A0ABQ8UV38_9EUKA|nr:putative X-ray repair cross-complementing protein 5 [Paratrimastix pyriformis]
MEESEEGTGFGGGSDFSTDFLFDENGEGGDGGEGGEGVATEKAQPSRDSIIFLIDCSPTMLQKNSAGEIPLHLSIRAAIESMKDKIISSENDLISIVFYAAEKKSNPNDFPNIFVFRPLDPPDAAGIRDLEALLNPAEFEERIGQYRGAEDFPLFYSLWICHSLFRSCTQKLGFKRIFLFTNNDSPNHDNKGARDRATERAHVCPCLGMGLFPNLTLVLFPSCDDWMMGVRDRGTDRGQDLTEAEIEIELFAMNGERPFDAHAFYSRILAGEEAIHTDVAQKVRLLHSLLLLPTRSAPFQHTSRQAGQIALRIRIAHCLFEEMRGLLRRRAHGKRAYARISLQIAPGVEVGVSLYHPVVPTKVPSAVPIDAKTELPLRSETRWICQGTGSTLRQEQMKLYQEYGKEKVAFSKEELKEIKRFGDPSIALMGFKPLAALKTKYNLTHCLFMYPCEDLITGSTTAFVALWTRMLERKLIAEERLREDGSQLSPPGFSIIALPWADDIRDLKVDPSPEKPTRDQVMKAKAMISKLTIDFSSDDFANPVIQRHYAALQALALGHDTSVVDEVPDLTMPATEHFQRHEDLITDFAQATAGAAKPRKRGAEGDAKEEKKKAPRHEAPTDDAAWKAVCEDGSVKKLNMDQLKAFLKGKRLATSGKKDDLVQRVMKHFGVAEPAGEEEAGEEEPKKPKKVKEEKDKPKAPRKAPARRKKEEEEDDDDDDE